jgi:thiol:disulfide interchange protein
MSFVHRSRWVFFALFIAATWSWVPPLFGQGLGIPGLDSGPADEPVKISAEFTLPTAERGPQLFVTAKIAPTWHTFSITQPAGGPIRTQISLSDSNQYKLAGEFKSLTPPDKHAEPAFGGIVVETHTGTVIWHAPLELAAGVDPQSLKIAGKITYQSCAESSCLPPKTVAFEAKPGPGVELPKPTAAVVPAGSSKPFQPTRAHAEITGRVEPEQIAPGGQANLVISIAPTEEYHVYPLPGEIAAHQVSRPTVIAFKDTSGLVAGRTVADRTPEKIASISDAKEINHQYEQPVSFAVPLTVPKDAKPGIYKVQGVIGLQTCIEKSPERSNCDLPTGVRFDAEIPIGVSGASTFHFEKATYTEAEQLAKAAPMATPQALVAEPATKSVNVPAAPAPATLGWMIVSALAGGLLLNLMPCVLPVIGLKILSFVEQSHHSRRSAFLLNFWFSAGLLAVFLVLATAACGATLGLADTNLGWGQQFQSPIFNIVMASIVFIMALSFLGVWEIPIPGFVGSGKTNELAAKEGFSGAFFKGVVTTLLATPCSGPFLGAVFGFTLTQPPVITYLLFACIGLGMAAPYLLIGAFPALVRFLPKPGAWMETFKQAMGFVLLGGVVFIFTFLKAVYVVPTFALLIGLWAGCWWIGRTPLYEGFRKLLPAYLTGMGVAAAVGFVAFSILLPGKGALAWQPYSPALFKTLTAQGKTVMVDFTADWCLACKTNLKLSIDRPDVAQVVTAGGVVPLLADLTEEDEDGALWNLVHSLGSNAIPVLAIYPADRPAEPIVLRDLIFKQQVLDALEKAGPSKPAGSTRITAIGNP